MKVIGFPVTTSAFRSVNPGGIPLSNWKAYNPLFSTKRTHPAHVVVCTGKVSALTELLFSNLTKPGLEHDRTFPPISRKS